jgi:hypothetical protein
MISPVVTGLTSPMVVSVSAVRFTGGFGLPGAAVPSYLKMSTVLREQQKHLSGQRSAVESV